MGISLSNFQHIGHFFRCAEEACSNKDIASVWSLELVRLSSVQNPTKIEAVRSCDSQVTTQTLSSFTPPTYQYSQSDSMTQIWPLKVGLGLSGAKIDGLLRFRPRQEELIRSSWQFECSHTASSNSTRARQTNWKDSVLLNQT